MIDCGTVLPSCVSGRERTGSSNGTGWKHGLTISFRWARSGTRSRGERASILPVFRAKINDSILLMLLTLKYVSLISLAALLMTAIGRADDTVEAIDYNRDIRPILSENCYHCHGPDAEARKGDLRLDMEADAAAALAPGDLSSSEVWHRVSTSDRDELMPPPKSKRRLNAKQKGRTDEFC